MIKNGQNNGSIYMDVLLTVFILILIVLPVFGYVAEIYTAYNTLQLVNDSVDASCIAVYNSIDIPAASKNTLALNETQMRDKFKQILCENLKLNSDMTPKQGSLAGGTVVIESIKLYGGGFPTVCENGTPITIMTFHVRVKMPIKPGIMKKYLKEVPGSLNIHRDYEIPVI